MSSTINLHPVKKIVITVCFVPLASRVLGMISAGNRAKFIDNG
jgi:hypothetical protein